MMRSDDAADREGRDGVERGGAASDHVEAANDRDDATSTSDDAGDEFEPATPVAADRSGATDSAGPSDDRLCIPLETISVLNWLGAVGVDGVEARLRQVGADDLTVETEQVKIGYARQEALLDQFGVEDHAGARVRMRKPVSGTVLVLFPVKSASRAASLMLQRGVEDAESVVSTPMGRDALTELCNVMANGFVDEWAETFDTPIDTDAPVAVQNPEMALINHVFSVSDVGLYLTSRFHVVADDIDATIFVFPGEAEFITKLSQLDLGVIYR